MQLRWMVTALTLCGLSLMVTSGCRGSQEAEAAPPAVQVPSTEPAVDPAELEHEAWLATLEEKLRDGFGELYESYLGAKLAPSALRYLLLDEAPMVSLRRAQFLAQLYDDRDYQMIFVRGVRLHERTEAVLEVLSRAYEHALDPDTYLRPELFEAVQRQRELGHAYRLRPRPELSGADVTALLGLAGELIYEDLEDPTAAVLDLLFEAPEHEGRFADLRRAHVERMRMERVSRGSAAIAEALLTDAVLAYAFDQRHFNVSNVMGDLSESEQHALIATRMRGTFDELAEASDREAATAVLDALPPHHPQYPLLVAERARYQAIVDAGGWEEVRPQALRRGSSGTRVRELQRRLQIEGYYHDEITDRFTAATEQALRDYQETHQMNITGETNREFWSSLNISAEQRLAQIELTMQRWRESQIGDQEYYILVNIPDFHTEVWNQGRRDMRFRTVVGNTQRRCDRRTNQMRYVNATPVQSSVMTYMVLNPYWNIPVRILEEALLPSLLEDDDYFARQGIERVEVGESSRVRQAPGPHNPLGRIKFMFPNPHNTYLHDTSRPQYFQYPIRAFSFGCMRVDDPLDFMQYLLEQDEQWDEARVNRIFESGVETSIRLSQGVPIFVEYYVVRVDDEGRANFLADIYRLDRDRMNPPDAASLRCTPDAPDEHRLVLGPEGRAMLRDREGNLIDPAELEAQRARDERASDPITAGDYGP